MALTTGNIRLCYSSIYPLPSDTGSTIGGTGAINNPVNLSTTGVFGTGLSAVPGGSTYVVYKKLFYAHIGNTGTYNNLRDPMIYITNETVSDQLYIAPDAYWKGVFADQTGGSLNSLTLPSGLVSGDFIGYSIDTPLRYSSLSRGQVLMQSGSTLGFWLKLAIPAGLQSSANNTFNIALRGETY